MLCKKKTPLIALMVEKDEHKKVPWSANFLIKPIATGETALNHEK
jgi:hypothetical protein